MRIFSILAVAFLVGIVPAHAQSDQTTGPPAPDRSYKLLTEDEDWSFLKDPALRQDFWDPIKYIPLAAAWRDRICQDRISQSEAKRERFGSRSVMTIGASSPI